MADTPARSAPPPVASAAAGPLGGQARDRLTGVGLVVCGMFSLQFGAAVAALLFPRAGVLGVVSLRLGISALVLLAVCRPAVHGHGREGWAVIVGFGAALAGMNVLIYQAIARIPLGTAVTLEVLGPLVLSVVAGRRASRWLWAGLALAGVALLGRGGLDDLNPAGVAFALGAAASWAAYILLSARAGSLFPRVDGLALAMTVGALLILPLGVAETGGALLQPVTLALGATVALLSSVLPYSLELLSLRRLPPTAFAVLMSLAPAVAALAGYLVLGQNLGIAEVVAVALVVIAGAGAVRPSANPSRRSGPRGTGRER
ncbi:EamA family transporter [Streptomyces griseiscabiei]|uniref:EamA family transporter n=1 Tax=Streptomyces griseiscabiei TaxID=2993540 RepID=A0ABU4L4A6_9ACTN|nr:EamA family transporter [Streptomyces griseiscabiei]MBZ3905427.1 EamA family transporter [Streptomyces griseiscabiei]MDX2910517.1 EamA family transporter [Streptomyces griseiscabiei]